MAEFVSVDVWHWGYPPITDVSFNYAHNTSRRLNNNLPSQIHPPPHPLKNKMKNTASCILCTYSNVGLSPWWHIIHSFSQIYYYNIYVPKSPGAVFFCFLFVCLIFFLLEMTTHVTWCQKKHELCPWNLHYLIPSSKSYPAQTGLIRQGYWLHFQLCKFTSGLMN